MADILWEPSEAKKRQSHLYSLIQSLAKKYKFKSDYPSLHQFSIDSSESFWDSIFDYFKIKFSGSKQPVFKSKGFDDYTWYPNLKLNFAENLLAKGKNNDIAIDFVHELGQAKSITYGELKSSVEALQNILIQRNFEASDVLACYMPNLPETVVSMLATSALGGVFTSTSIDFGIAGVVDRLSQSKPKILVTVPSYSYNGKAFDVSEKIKSIVEQVPEIETIIWVNVLELTPSEDVPSGDQNISWPKSKEETGNDIKYLARDFSDPLYIMYSSGTTGVPKCIVHSVGGTLLQHVKELGLHTDLKSSDTIFYYTTCGWMMWNWLMSSLFFGAKLVLYEGSPSYPSLKDFFENLIQRYKINIFGTSPKFLKALEDSDYQPSPDKLTSLKTLLSTGAPLMPEQFDFVYKKIKRDLWVSSICGGTDILGCFLIGNPLLPVVRGELQCAALGMAVACFNEEGESVLEEEGELVCQQSFPSVPLCFLGDTTREKYQQSYFNKFPGVWHHGDFIKMTERGSFKVLGRSDATLNPGGVRIGTSEIYRQTEQLSYIEDSLCVGKQTSDDQEVWLFVKMSQGEVLDEIKVKEIKSLIRARTTPRHVPKYIKAVNAIPYTRSGKKVELAVARIINGREPDNLEALANPESLAQFK